MSIKRTNVKTLYRKLKSKRVKYIGLISYSYIHDDGSIHVDMLCVDFRNDEGSILDMEKVEEKHGESFMFFNDSNEGLSYYQKNTNHFTLD